MGFPNHKGFPIEPIPAGENLASTILVFIFLALGVFGIAQFGGSFDAGGMLPS